MSTAFDALNIVAIAVLVLAAIAILLSLIVVGHHILTDNQRRRNRERFEAAAVVLAPHLVSNSPGLNQAVQLARRQAGDRAVALVLRRTRHELNTAICDRITEILEGMGEVEILLKDSASRRDWKRTLAIRGLGECGGIRALRALASAADDPSGEVRRAARDGLLSDGSPRALQIAIQSFLRDLPRRAGWRRSFYARLAITGAEELSELVRSGQLAGAEEKLAIEALGDAGCSNALKLALERIGSEEAEMRATAVRVLGKVGTERDLPLILEGLRDSHWFVRAASARSLEWLLTLRRNATNAGSQQNAAERLGTCLTDSSWWVRANAARALSRIGEPGVNVLLRHVNNTDRYARDAAIAALAVTPLPSEARLAIKKKIDSVIEAADTAAPMLPVTARPVANGGVA